MENIDLTQWPTWLVALLLILNLFKTPIANMFPAISRLWMAKAEREDIEAEGHRQDEVAEKLMLASLVQQSLDQNKELIEFLKGVVVSRIDNVDLRMDSIDTRLMDITNEFTSMKLGFENMKMVMERKRQ